MSAGKFTQTFYEASYGAGDRVHPIRVQAETIAASIGTTTNVSTETDANNPISAQVSNGKNELGLKPRTVALRSPATSPPAGYEPNSRTVIPAVTEAFWNAATKNADVSYLGVTFKVINRFPEQAQ